MEYYLVPKEDIERLEEARLNMHYIMDNNNINTLNAVDVIFNVTSKIYNVTHKNYKKTIKEN